MNRLAIFTATSLLAFASAWHIFVERQPQLFIVIDGVPATSPLKPLLRNGPPVFPDVDGRYGPVSSAAEDMFEFKSDRDTNWLFRFPESGRKTIAISGTDIKTTKSMSYFGLYTHIETVEQTTDPLTRKDRHVYKPPHNT